LGADLTALPSTWSWTDISNYVRFASGISTRQGRADEQSTVSTSAGQLTLDNRDGRFSRRNPNSPYFGSLTFNTPIWATVDPGSGPVTRMQMFVNEWPTRWDRSGKDSTVPIQCAGIMRRLQQGTVLKSAMRRAVLGATQPTPLAYWPCEDGAGSASVASGLPGGSPMVGTPVFGSSFGGSSGSLDVAAMNDTLAPVGSVTLTSASGCQVECMAKSDSGSAELLISLISGTFSASVALASAISDGLPHHISVQLVQDGSNVDVSSYRDGVLSSTTPVVGVLATSLSVRLRGGAGTGTSIAHVVVYNFADMTEP